MKKIYLTITALCLFITAIDQAQPQQFNPKNTTITFDLDDVVLKKNKKEMKQQAWENIRFGMVFRNLFNGSLNNARKLYQKGASAEEFILLFEEGGQHDVAAMIKKITNEKNPIDGTVNIINELKKRGYILHVASNMGTGHYQEMKNKFPEVFKHFEKVKVVPYEERYKNGTPVFEKPDPQYFKDYLREHNGDNKNIVFIDDKQENIDAAQSVNITGIKFDNPEQLRTDLQKLGVL